MSSTYRPGYEAWEIFDSLPKVVRDAHNIVWTGCPRFTNQHRERLNMITIREDDARAIIELDNGAHMLDGRDIGINP